MNMIHDRENSEQSCWQLCPESELGETLPSWSDTRDHSMISSPNVFEHELDDAVSMSSIVILINFMSESEKNSKVHWLFQIIISNSIIDFKQSLID